MYLSEKPMNIDGTKAKRELLSISKRISTLFDCWLVGSMCVKAQSCRCQCMVPADEYQSTENSVSLQDYDKKLQHHSRMKVFVLLPQRSTLESSWSRPVNGRYRRKSSSIYGQICGKSFLALVSAAEHRFRSCSLPRLRRRYANCSS